MKYALIIAATLLSESAFGQYFIDSYAGRLGPVPGMPATSAMIDVQGLMPGPTGNLLYCSTQQVVEVDAAGNIGVILGPDKLRFDLADHGSRDYQITACASDAAGNIYLFDGIDSRLLRIGPAGAISAFAIPIGRPVPLTTPYLAAEPGGSVYVSGPGSVIRKVDFERGTVTIVAGGGSVTWPAPDGTAATAASISPGGATVAADGTLYYLDALVVRKIDGHGLLATVADLQSHPIDPGRVGVLTSAPDGSLLVADDYMIRRIDTASGTVSAIGGGKLVYGYFVEGWSLLADASGAIYFGQPAQISTIDDATGTVTPYAGTGQLGPPGNPVRAADLQLDGQAGISQTAVGADGTLYIAEPLEQRIRVIDPTTKISRTIPAYTNAHISPLSSIALDSNGNVIYSAYCEVRSLNPTTGISIPIIDLSSNCTLGAITSIAVDSANNIYVSDESIWKVDATTGQTSKFVDAATIQSFFGFPLSQFSGNPTYMAFDPSGNLYFTIRANFVYLPLDAEQQILKIAQDGTVSRAAPPTYPAFTGLVIGTDGGLYVANDTTVSRVDLTTGEFTQIAGSPRTDVPIDAGDRGPALDARIHAYSLAAGPAGSLFITDNYFVRRICAQDSRQ